MNVVLRTERTAAGIDVHLHDCVCGRNVIGSTHTKHMLCLFIDFQVPL